MSDTHSTVLLLGLIGAAWLVLPACVEAPDRPSADRSIAKQAKRKTPGEPSSSMYPWIPPPHERERQKALWRNRVEEVMATGRVPLIDLTCSVNDEAYIEENLATLLSVMDQMGLAIIAFDGKPHNQPGPQRYQWSYYVNHLVDLFPDRFVLAPNRGNNLAWMNQTGTYLGMLADEIRTGEYPLFSEIAFMHFLTPDQCRKGKLDMSFDIPIDGPTGHELFRLARETHTTLFGHIESNRAHFERLGRMLELYPDVPFIHGHFGRILLLGDDPPIGAADYRRLLADHPNYYADIHAHVPNQRHSCSLETFLTDIWARDEEGRQTDRIKPEYAELIEEFPDRFIIGLVYRVRSGDLLSTMTERLALNRGILSVLSPETQHRLGYKNAWTLLTGEPW